MCPCGLSPDSYTEGRYITLAIRIGQNIASLTAQRRLSDATSGLVKSFERLSSGLRVNSPSDDSAAFAVAMELKLKSRLSAQACRNINDGISLLNTAEGALQSLSAIAVRQKELATQAAQGTLSITQRRAVDAEADALVKEYNRIVTSTSFNGINLFTTASSISIAAGEGSAASITFDTASALQRATGDGTFQAQRVISGVTGAMEPVSGLYDADSIPDLLVVDAGGMLFLHGNGDGSFTAGVTVAKDVARILTGDFNNDSITDVCSQDASGAALIMLGNGDGTFRKQGTYAMNETRGREAADVNGDGNIDIVLAGFTDFSVHVLLGNGDGSFKAQSCYSLGHRVHDVTCVDVNNDGNMDILSADDTNNSMSVLLGNGNGTFRAASSFTAGWATSTVSVADVNHDGYLDGIVSNKYSYNISILMGNGDGTFKAQACYATGVDLYSHYTADLNSDGITDLAGLNLSTSNVSILLGKEDGTFSAQTCYAAGTWPTYGSFADFNGDGALDMSVANTTSDSISIFLANLQHTPAIARLDLLTEENARSALTAIDETISRVGQAISEAGAAQSRLKYAARHSQLMRTSCTEAESRIMDVDVAEETANLVKNQILQQASAAMLGQADISAKVVLKLLE